MQNPRKVLGDRSLKELGKWFHLAHLTWKYATRTDAGLQAFSSTYLGYRLGNVILVSIQSCSFSIQSPPERFSRLKTILSNASAIGSESEGTGIRQDRLKPVQSVRKAKAPPSLTTRHG